MSTIGQRLTQYIEYKEVTKRELSEKIDVHYNYLVRLLKDNKALSSITLEKVFTAFPELNVRWLLTGVGKMEYSQGSADTVVMEKGEIYGSNFKANLLEALESQEVRDKLLAIMNLYAKK